MAYHVELRKGRNRGVWESEENLAAISAAVRRFIIAHDLTMHTWTGGRLCDDSERVIGSVSYNGKVWGPGACPAAPLLYDPYAWRAAS